MTKYFINFFHTLIIASFILSFSGCGYKGPPVYVNDVKSEQNSKEVTK